MHTLVNKKIYGYLRLSKEDGDVTNGKADESSSIDSQRQCIRQYLNTHPEMDNEYEEILDDGFSGTHMSRPGMVKLLNLVETGAVDTIIVRDLSRFARNYINAGYYLELFFPTHNIRFISINDRYDSAGICGDSEGIHFAVKNLMNQMYSKDLSKKIKSAVDLKKKSGQYVYGAVPFGYKKGTEKNTIIVDTEAAKIVRMIFELASGGETVTRIARLLNNDKVITPSVYLAELRPNYKQYPLWTYTSVANILKNRIYSGDTIPFRSHVVTVGSDRVKQVPVKEQEIIPNTHDGIVSRKMFLQANEVIKTNVKSKQIKPSSALSTFLVCYCCGYKLYKGRVTNKTFKCATARYVSDMDCSKVQLNEQQAIKVVLNAINYQCEILNEKISGRMKNHAGKITESEALASEHKKSERNLKEIRDLKIKYYENYASGLIGKDEFVKIKEELTESEEDYKLQLRLLEEKNKESSEKILKQKEIINKHLNISKYKNLEELTPELLKELIQRIIVYPEGKLHIVWNFADYYQDNKIVKIY